MVIFPQFLLLHKESFVMVKNFFEIFNENVLGMLRNIRKSYFYYTIRKNNKVSNRGQLNDQKSCTRRLTVLPLPPIQICFLSNHSYKTLPKRHARTDNSFKFRCTRNAYSFRRACTLLKGQKTFIRDWKVKKKETNPKRNYHRTDVIR